MKSDLKPSTIPSVVRQRTEANQEESSANASSTQRYQQAEEQRSVLTARSRRMMIARSFEFPHDSVPLPNIVMKRSKRTLSAILQEALLLLDENEDFDQQEE